MPNVKPLWADDRNKNKCRRIGKIWRRSFFWWPFRNFLGLLAPAKIFCVLAIDQIRVGEC